MGKPAATDRPCLRSLSHSFTLEEIARVLNRQGRRTGKGNRWTKHRVAAARRRYVINGHLSPAT